jgi:hypothetical protein
MLVLCFDPVHSLIVIGSSSLPLAAAAAPSSQAAAAAAPPTGLALCTRAEAQELCVRAQRLI